MFLDTGARPGATLAAVPLARYITHKTSLYDHALAQRGRLQPRSLRQHRLLELGRPQPRDARKGHEEETKVEQRRRWDREGQEACRPAHHANARAPNVRRLRRERILPLPVAMCVVACDMPVHPPPGSIHTPGVDVQMPPVFSQASLMNKQLDDSPHGSTLVSEHDPRASHFSCVSWNALEHEPATPGP